MPSRSREFYNIHDWSTPEQLNKQLNFIFNSIMDRLDRIDGSRGSAEIAATLDINGGVGYNRVDIEKDYTVLDNDYYINCKTSSSAITVTIPTSLLVDGREINIKDTEDSASINNITISPEGKETIDGDVTKIVNTNSSSVTIYSDGEDWFIK